MSDFDDFMKITPVFLLIGGAMLAGYFAPYILGVRILKHEEKKHFSN